MAGAASYNEAMPYGVAVRNLLPRVKHDADRVQHSASQQPKDSALRDREKHRLDCNKREPTHQEVLWSKNSSRPESP